MFLYILGVSWTKDSLHGLGYCEFMGGWIPVLNMQSKYWQISLLTKGFDVPKLHSSYQN